jgi:hypothetical protein
MRARVMLSSVTKDDLPLGDLKKLKGFWHDSETLNERLPKTSGSPKPASRVDFTFVRKEIQRHLECKYGFEVYNFQNTPSDGASPEQATIRETRRSHLVIGIFGSRVGWKVADHDPLTPTFREWRTALENPLKFKVFVLKSSLELKKPPEVEQLLEEITNYKKGLIYQDFVDLAGLFSSVDDAVRDYVNKSVIRYAFDYAAKQPTDETERWLLLPYRARVREMHTTLEEVAENLGVKQNVLTLDSVSQPVDWHCVPDNFSIPESKKFAAYIFDDEEESDSSSEPAKLQIVAAFGSISDSQIRRHLGNFEAAEVYSDSWGFYATVRASGIQCLYLPRCVNSAVMESKLSGAISWLDEHAREIRDLALRRRRILELSASSNSGPGKPRNRKT